MLVIIKNVIYIILFLTNFLENFGNEEGEIAIQGKGYGVHLTLINNQNLGRRSAN